jgi:hypothetical protein
VTVSPLPVNWSQSSCDNVCNTDGAEVVGPISVNSAGLATCAQGYSGTAPVQVEAPADPNLPPDTQNVKIVRGTASLTCF